MNDSDLLDLLLRTGFAKVLLRVASEDTRLSNIGLDRHNRQGIASDSIIKELRPLFVELGLIREQLRKEDRRGKPSTFLIITDKGRRVARAIERVVEEMQL